MRVLLKRIQSTCYYPETRARKCPHNISRHGGRIDDFWQNTPRRFSYPSHLDAALPSSTQPRTVSRAPIFLTPFY